MALRTRRDRMPYEVGIETTELYPASKLLTEIIGVEPQPNKAIVGRNAFAHEAGIHQDGFLKERTTYEIIVTVHGKPHPLDAAHVLAQVTEQLRELIRHRVADRVGNVHGGRSRGDRHLHHLGEELELGARSVFG